MNRARREAILRMQEQARRRGFDAVVNVDGFNEVTLPLAENVPLGVAVHYPRSWPAYARKGLDAEGQVLLVRAAGSG